MLIYKIFRPEEWQNLQVNGATDGAPIDIADGFVHFSTAGQVAETAARHFAGAENLTLVACDAKTLGAELKWDVSRGGALFPHLYRRLRMSDVVWSQALPFDGTSHRFPDAMQ